MAAIIPIFLNNASSLVLAGSSAIGSASNTGINVTTGDGSAQFGGSVPTACYIPAVIVDPSTNPETIHEYVWITAISTDALTVTRQAESSAAYPAGTSSIQAGFRIVACATKGSLPNPPFNNLTAVVDPATTDDVTKGYTVGSLWINTASNTPQASLFVCITNTTSAAVWRRVTGDVQVFASSGTWTKPLWSTVVEVVCIGSGGSGGSGAKIPGDCSGGCGGGGATMATMTYLASALGSTETVTVGATATGAVGQVTASSAGHAGADGNSSSFGATPRLVAAGGGKGTGGATGGVNGGGAGATAGMFSAGGVGANSFAAAAGGTPGGVGVCGGGASGGGNTSTTTPHNGGVGAGTLWTGAAGGTAGTGSSTPSAGGDGGGAAANEATPGAGGGGGGSTITAAVTGGAGGKGGRYGGGGGGGGASNTGTSGAGGDGGAGVVIIISQ